MGMMLRMRRREKNILGWRYLILRRIRKLTVVV